MTSFVHPERVPQMADAEAVVAGLTPHDDVVYAALVLNERGYDRALAAGIREVNTVVITTETFSQRNQGMSVAEAVEVVSKIRARAAADGIRVDGDDLGGLRLPVRGRGAARHAHRVATQVAAIGADEIVLADTIGVAVPSDVEERIAVVREIGARGALRAHFHNTRNTGRRERRRGGSLRRDRDRCLAGRDRRLPLRPRRHRATSPPRISSTRSSGWGTRPATTSSARSRVRRWIAGELGIEPPGMVARAGGFPDRR